MTDVTRWPDINKGITKETKLLDGELKETARFRESISSPIPMINDWTNEWTITKLCHGELFVIEGQDNFTSVPIRSRISYQFARGNNSSTVFSRKIEVSVDDQFVQKADKNELEALYRFLGSQWEMASHLRAYVEAL